MSRVDNWIEILENRITKSVQVFASSVFVLFTIGMIFGIYFYNFDFNYWFLVLPPLLALIAYYNRTISFLVVVLSAIVFFV